MPKVKVYNLNGEVVQELELSEAVFGVKVKPAVVHQVVEAQDSNSRQVIAHAKGRSEVRGGGRKPWRQKGTGRARHGSIRSPLWKGGGVTFGPTKERNFKKEINQKVKTLALRMVLSDKAAYQHLILVEDLILPQSKTKVLMNVLNKLPIKNKSVLIALAKKNEPVILSSRNLPQVATEPLASLNVVDLLKFEYLLTTVEAVNQLAKRRV